MKSINRWLGRRVWVLLAIPIWLFMIPSGIILLALDRTPLLVTVALALAILAYFLMGQSSLHCERSVPGATGQCTLSQGRWAGRPPSARTITLPLSTIRQARQHHWQERFDTDNSIESTEDQHQLQLLIEKPGRPPEWIAIGSITILSKDDELRRLRSFLEDRNQKLFNLRFMPDPLPLAPPVLGFGFILLSNIYDNRGRIRPLAPGLPAPSPSTPDLPLPPTKKPRPKPGEW